MTEPISFGANGYCEKYRCDQNFWIYPQENKGRVIDEYEKIKMLKKLIQQIIIPLSVAGVVILIGLFLTAEQHYGSPALRGGMEVFLIFIIPILPIIYGVITKDKVGAILIGVMPLFALLMLTLIEELVQRSFPLSFVFMGWLIKAVINPFWLISITIVALEGYFASLRDKSSVLIACGLYILWIFVFFSFGIN